MSLSLEENMKVHYYWTAKIQLQLFRAINEYLKENDMTRKEFADQLGVSKGYVSQILNGNFDHKLSKMIELMLAIGMVPSLEMVPVEEAIAAAKGKKKKKPAAKRKKKASADATKRKASDNKELVH